VQDLLVPIAATINPPTGRGFVAMSGTRRDKAILVAGLISDRVGLALLFIVFGPVARDLGLSELQFGVLIASANLTLGLASPYWGRKSQTLGRKPVFVIGLSGYALGFLLLAVALQAGLSGWLYRGPLFLVLLAVRLGYGLLAAATQPAATAYLADITDAHDRTRGMALIGIAAGIGTVLGPLMGGGLSVVGTVLPLYVAAGVAAAAAALAHGGLREPSRRAASAGGARLRVSDRRIFPYLAGWCLAVLVLTAVQTLVAFYLEDGFALAEREQVTRAASVTFLVMGLAMILTQALLLQVRVAPTVLLSGGFALCGLALLTLLAARDLGVLYAAFAMLGVGFSALGPGLNAAASLSVTDREQGAVAGLLAAAPVLGMVLGPVTGTALYGVDPAWPLALGAVGAAGMAICFSVRTLRAA
jgi:MFS family permease